MERTEKMQDLVRETCQILDKFGLDNASFYYQVQAGAFDETYWSTMYEGEEQPLDHPSELGFSHSDSLALFTAIVDVEYGSVLAEGSLDETGMQAGMLVFIRIAKNFWQVNWETEPVLGYPSSTDAPARKEAYRIHSAPAGLVPELSKVVGYDDPAWG